MMRRALVFVLLAVCPVTSAGAQWDSMSAGQYAAGIATGQAVADDIRRTQGGWDRNLDGATEAATSDRMATCRRAMAKCAANHRAEAEGKGDAGLGALCAKAGY